MENIDRDLEGYRLKMIKLLTEDLIIKKDTYKIENNIVNGKEVKERVYAGHRAINCKNSGVHMGKKKANDWSKGNNLYRGKSARERVRLVIQELRKIAKEARAYSLELDKISKD